MRSFYRILIMLLFMAVGSSIEKGQHVSALAGLALGVAVFFFYDKRYTKEEN